MSTPGRHGPRSDDDERDAWLSEALRHAPDASADAPPTLSEAILREARAAAARSMSSGPRHPKRSRWSAWDWFARPPVVASFASVVVATLIGLMWWDRPLDETLARAPAGAAPQPHADAPAGVAARQAERAASDSVTAGNETAVPQHPPAALARRDDTARRAAPQSAESAKATRSPKPADEGRRQRTDPAAAPATAAAAQRASIPAADTADRRSAKASLAAAADPRAPLAGLLAAIAQQPERWSWQRGGGEAQAMTAPLQRWLALLERSAAARWRPGTEPAQGDASGVLRLLRDGTPQATLTFGSDGLRLETTGAATPAASVATLPPASIDALKAALNDATR